MIADIPDEEGLWVMSSSTAKAIIRPAPIAPKLGERAAVPSIKVETTNTPVRTPT